MHFNDKNMVANTIHNQANTESNFYIIMMVQLEKKFESRMPKCFGHSQGKKFRVEANNNSERIRLIYCPH